jgi:hypothetical protein
LIATQAVARFAFVACRTGTIAVAIAVTVPAIPVSVAAAVAAAVATAVAAAALAERARHRRVTAFLQLRKTDAQHGAETQDQGNSQQASHFLYSFSYPRQSNNRPAILPSNKPANCDNFHRFQKFPWLGNNCRTCALSP